MDRHSSHRLLVQAKQGNREALGQLLDQFRPYMRVLVRGTHRGWLDGRADDSDLVQDALVEVTRSFDRFQGAEVAEFLAWLRQVVVHTVHKSVRQFVGTRKRNPGGGGGIDPDGVSSPAAGPDRVAANREEAAQVAEAVERLPADMRQVILMRLVDGLPHAAIAERIGRSEQATRMLFVRAVRRLQELVPE